MRNLNLNAKWRKGVLLHFSLIPFITFTLSCSNKAESLQSDSKTKSVYSISSAEISYKETLPVYSQVRSEFDEKYALEEANKFGVSGRLISEENSFSIISGDTEVVVDKKMGSSFFKEHKKMWGVDGQPVGEIKKDELKSIAENFVREKGLLNLKEAHFFRANKLHRTSSAVSGNDIMQYEVVYKRIIDGRLVLGSGSQLSVFIGANRRIVGVLLDWPELESLASSAVKNPSEVPLQVKEAVDSINTRFVGEAKINYFNVNKVTLSYAGKIDSNGVRHVFPAYLAYGTKQIADSAPEQDVMIIEATEKPVNIPMEYKPSDTVPPPASTTR